MTRFRDISIRQLRALAAVAASESITAAAAKLHLTQPAVTLQLRNLQALAGLPLIQRSSNGMLLTDAGREVLALAERIEAAMAACETSLEMMAGSWPVAFCTYSTSGPSMVPESVSSPYWLIRYVIKARAAGEASGSHKVVGGLTSDGSVVTGVRSTRSIS